MATRKINLLPTNLAAPSDVLKVVDNIKRITVTVFIIFFLVAAGGAALLFFAFRNNSDLKNKNTELETNISNLQKTEQKLVLIRDRIEKVKTINANSDASTNVDKLNRVILSKPSDISLNSATIDVDKTKFSVISKSSNTMATFLKSVAAVPDFKKISLISFTFTPSVGYDITLEID